jgi:outer membrane protein TolC
MKHIPLWIRSVRTLTTAVLAVSLGHSPAPAQQGTPARGPGGSLRRVFFGNYTPPQVRVLEPGEDSLEKMVRDGRLQVSESDVIRLVLENDPELQVERYGPYFSLWGVDKARASLNPSLGVSTHLNRILSPTTSILQGADTILDLATVNDVSLRVPFERGLDMDLSLTTRRSRTSSTFFTVNPSFTTTASIGFTQHLLRDSGRISRGRFLSIARNDYGISEEEFAIRVTNQVAEALNTYWELAFASEEEKARQASLKLAELVLEQVQAQLELGTKTPLDVAQAKAEVAARTEQGITARSNRRIAVARLKSLISSRIDAGTVDATVDLTSEVSLPPPSTEPVTQAIQRAMEIRPELRRSALELETKKIAVEYTRNQLRPTLDLAAGYSQNGLGGDRVLRDYGQNFLNAPILSIEKGGLGDSLDSLFSRRFLGYSVGLTFRISIGNDDARARNAQAQIEQRKSEANLRLLRHRIALEVREAHEVWERDRARVEAAEAGAQYNEKRLKGEQDLFAFGESTTRQVLEVQRDLAESRTRLLRAKIDLIRSQIALGKATGDLLAVHQINLKEALGNLR